jgi:hypothetical protein
MEELGGSFGPTHNQLYRDVLIEVGIDNEETIPEPKFAQRFNEEWKNYCLCAPLEQALTAIAIYEVLDNPDYRLLLGVIKSGCVGPKAHVFFDVHAHAQHFELFESFVLKLFTAKEGAKVLRDAETFVFGMQKSMWRDLLSYVEASAIKHL